MLNLVVLIVVSRALVPAAFTFFDYLKEAPIGDPATFLLHHFDRWDATWYAQIANHGYGFDMLMINRGASEWAFYPLMPLLTRWTAALGGWDVRIVGVVLAHLFFAAAVGLFHRYCRRRGADEEIALRATALLCFAPHSFIFSCFYTESLFLLLSLAVLNFLDTGRPVRGGLVGALLTATRSNGLIIGAYYLFAVGREIALGLKERVAAAEILRRAAPLLLGGACVPLGLFAYWWFCFHQTGDAFAQAHSLAAGWDWEPIRPWEKIGKMFADGDYDRRFWGVWGLSFVASSLLLLRHRLTADFLFCAFNFGLFFSGSLDQSLIRYIILLFPLYLGIALTLKHRTTPFVAVLTVFTATNILLLHAWDAENILGI